MNYNLTPSNIIEIIGIIVSLCTSLFAITISVKTLKQNSQMIEDSTRPYIGIYGGGIYVKSPDYYIVLKNFGQSSATIKSFSYDFDLAKCIDADSDHEPFEKIENSTLVPGQSFQAAINLPKTIAQTTEINFHVVYSSNTHQYEDDICLNLVATVGNCIVHKTTKGQELSIISETLQDINIHSL